MTATHLPASLERAAARLARPLRHPAPPPPGARVAVAMSGGVDSSVAAALLVEAGYQVVGFTMWLYDEPAGGRRAARSCCAPVDVADARRVADQLGIPHQTLDLRARFAAEVIDDFAAEYARGRTPSPCVRCNQKLKYDTLVQAAAAVGADTLATGHYAAVARAAADAGAGAAGGAARAADAGAAAPLGGTRAGGAALRLARATDLRRDQSYFLFTLGSGALAHALFPLGAWTKPEVRAHARELGLATADKPDSMEICFVPDGDHRGLVARRLGAAGAPAPAAGDIVDTEGRTLGRHGGVHGFTIGQRHGLGVSAAEPLYVLAIDAAAARLTVGPRAALGFRAAHVEQVCWPDGHPPAAPLRALVQVRHHHRGAPALVEPDGASAAHVRFDAPEEAVSPGQAAVFYVGDQVAGGGFLREGLR